MDIVLWLERIFIIALPAIFAITVHEVAHGWVANRCGDDTATRLGRVTLNPLVHIDLIGTIIVPIFTFMTTGFIFGWAKPVPVNFTRLRRPEMDTIMVALAGPVSNLIMACFWGILIAVLFLMARTLEISTTFLLQFITIVLIMSAYGVLVNIVLMVFNLVPIPPLDGGRVLQALVPASVANVLRRLEPYGFLILIIAMILGLGNYVISPLVLRVMLLIPGGTEALALLAVG